jgi:hypothetical protein
VPAHAGFINAERHLSEKEIIMARTVVETIAGATLAISANIPVTYDSSGYGGSNVIFTAVGSIENWGNHGVTGTIVEFTPVDTGVVNKMKGSKNYGSIGLVIGSIPGDAGQAILKLAAESTAHYSAKLTYPDGEIHYLDVIVGKFEYQDGAVNDVQKIACDLAVSRAPVIIAAP